MQKEQEKEEHDFQNFFSEIPEICRKPTLRTSKNKVTFNEDYIHMNNLECSPEFGAKASSLCRVDSWKIQNREHSNKAQPCTSTKLTFREMIKKDSESFENENEESQNKSFKITDLEVQANSKLELIDFEGNLISEKRLLINAAGLSKGGLRSISDGLVNFGPTKCDRNGKIINDYLLNIQSKHPSPIYFQIRFSLAEKRYYLCCERAEDEVVILFMKLNTPFVSEFFIMLETL